MCLFVCKNIKLGNSHLVIDVSGKKSVSVRQLTLELFILAASKFYMLTARMQPHHSLQINLHGNIVMSNKHINTTPEPAGDAEAMVGMKEHAAIEIQGCRGFMTHGTCDVYTSRARVVCLN